MKGIDGKRLPPNTRIPKGTGKYDTLPILYVCFPIVFALEKQKQIVIKYPEMYIRAYTMCTCRSTLVSHEMLLLFVQRPNIMPVLGSFEGVWA